MDAVVLGGHRHQVTLAAGHRVNHLGGVFLGDIDGQKLDRLAFDPVDFLDDYLRLAHLQFIPLAAHSLDKHREMQHTTTEDIPFVLVVALGDAQRKVLVKLAGEAFLDVAGGDKLAVLTEERRVIDGECHRHRGLVYGDTGQRLGIVKQCDSVANLKILETHQRADVARRDLLDALASHPLECVELLDFLAGHRTVAAAEAYLHTLAEGATVYTSHGDTSHIA